ncbi:MAG: hypothetical protein CMJ75_20170 [Planctomycetaceae bacterium]|nr:hypothetical protein [Planctomycetaceae bacterium]
MASFGLMRSDLGMPRVSSAISLGITCRYCRFFPWSVRWRWVVGVSLLSLGILGCGSEQTEHVDVIPEATDDVSLVYDRSTAPINPEALLWSLEKEDQEYLWDLEHHSNLLVQYGLRDVGAAVVGQRVKDLVEQFSSDFSGETFSKVRKVMINDAIISSVRRSADDSESRRIDKAELAEFLVAFAQPLGDSARFRFDIKRIFPLDRQRLDDLWTALVVLRVWNDRVVAAPQEVSLLFRLVFERPSKERFASSGWIHGLKLLQVADSRAQRSLFREVTSDLGIDSNRFYDNWKETLKKENPGGIYACDFNRDNCVDLLITDGRNPPAEPDVLCLYQGLAGGGFRDVTQQMGLDAARYREVRGIHAVFVDLDNDGWEDLVFSRGDIWKNQQGKRFVHWRVASSYYQVTGGGAVEAREEFGGITVADYDRDGLVDLYVHRSGGTPKSWIEDVFDSPVRNLLLRNLGDWKFENVTQQSGTDGGGRVVFSSAWFDANNDSWPDLYVINEFGDGILYVNRQDGTFKEVDVDPKTDDFGSMGIATGDIDNNGHIDLYLGGMYSKAGSRVIGNLPEGIYPEEVVDKLDRLISGSEFYQNNGELNFHAQASKLQIHDVGWAWGPTLADFNNDGWLDLFATAGYMSRDRTKPDG